MSLKPNYLLIFLGNRNSIKFAIFDFDEILRNLLWEFSILIKKFMEFSSNMMMILQILIKTGADSA